MKNNITKDKLFKYIKEYSENLYKINLLKEEKERVENSIKLMTEGKYSEKASDFIGKEISHLENDKGYKHDRAVATAINVAKKKGMKVPDIKKESEEIAHNPKAAIRNRGDVVFQSDSRKVKDDKDHFPINNQSQARNAISRVNQFSEVPSWYKGSVQDLVDAVVKSVNKKYPNIQISKEARKRK